MTQTNTILYAGGGSLGHIAPNVAIARAMNDTHAHFACGEWKTETEYLEKEGFAYTMLPSPRIGLSFLWKFPIALFKALTLLNTINPDLVMSKGGNISVAVCVAAYFKKIPIVLHESDVVMGRANRMILRLADAVCTGFPLPNLSSNQLHTGNPLRPGITEGNREEGMSITGLTGAKPVLIVVGGSQGAQVINECITENIDTLLEHCEIIHITGPGKETRVARDGYWQAPLVTTELPHLYALSDFAVSRASANFMSELSACSIPMILIPLKGLAHDHQYWNAEKATESNGCLMIDQEETEKIVETILSLSTSPEKRKEMSQNVQKLSKKDASGQIARIIVDTLAERTKRQ